MNDSTDDTPDSTVEDAVSGAVDLLTLVAWIGAGLAAALVLSFIIAVAMRLTARRHPWARTVSRRGRTPLRAVLAVLGVWAGVELATRPPEPAWLPAAQHVLLIVLIAAITWLVGSLVYVVEDLALARNTTASNRARRIRTQAQVLRRVGVAVVIICGIGAILFTFDGARAAGASLFASAGLLSLVAGLAAQSSLANLFAGMQLAFSDAIRVDDIVIAQGEWGRIEEITLTYVVLHTWDDRRLILPSTYFTTTPFENWTRRAGDLLGTVEFDLDWRVPVHAMRAELDRVLRTTDLWDGRVGLFQVYDTSGGLVRVRALVSAPDAPTQIDLKYHIRESLLLWLQRAAPYALPRTRLQSVEAFTAAEPDVAEEPEELEEPEATPDTGPQDAPVVARLDLDEAARQEAALRRERRLARKLRKRTGAEESGEGRHKEGQRGGRRPRPSSDETRLLDLSELALLDAHVRPAAPGRTAADMATAAPDDGASGPAAGSTGDPKPADPERGDAEPAPTGRSDLPAAAVAVTEEGHPVRSDEAATRRTSVYGRVSVPPAGNSRFFTGSAEAEARAQAFAGPGEEVLHEREETAERHRAAELGEDVEPGPAAGDVEETRTTGGESSPQTAVLPAVGDDEPGPGAAPHGAGDERSRGPLPGGDIRGRDIGDAD